MATSGPMRLSSLRSERGQTAGEYMGILLLVAVIVGALIRFDVDGKIAKGTGDMVDLIAGGGKHVNAARNPGGGGNPRAAGNPGGSASPSGSGNPSGSADDEQKRIT